MEWTDYVEVYKQEQVRKKYRKVLEKIRKGNTGGIR